MQEEITISAKYYNRLSTVFFISSSSQSNLPSPNLSEWVTTPPTPPTLPFLVSSPLVSVWRMNGGVREVDFLRFSSPCLLVEGDRMVSGWFQGGGGVEGGVQTRGGLVPPAAGSVGVGVRILEVHSPVSRCMSALFPARAITMLGLACLCSSFTQAFARSKVGAPPLPAPTSHFERCSHPDICILRVGRRTRSMSCWKGVHWTGGALGSGDALLFLKGEDTYLP
ncbi:hypothetical protein F7725_002488 [Dissostichus mawsoni]|uniref:Uncharacterized protein n=1 Tax=Dissostichus mawsoni TaxID=36200 RepID=A0A7J5Y4B7_DISMA|nr:hypothetical protein F7725_002488 [Dissostichus mawsoni]